MRVRLKYGKGGVEGNLPDSWNIATLAPAALPPLADPSGVLDRLLGAPFEAQCKDKKSIAVIVPDVTRMAGVHLLLPLLLRRLERVGHGPSSVVVVFASGIHPPMTEGQKASIVTADVLARYRCIQHNAREQCAERGGVMLNPRVAAADGIIIIGAVKAHYLAGFGGGRKAVLPGVASAEECMRLHRLSLDPDGGGRHPRIGPGILEGNPMHEAATAAARAAGVDLLINTVMDDEGNLLFLNAGGLEEAFAEACAFAAKWQEGRLERAADVVIASCGGFPGDINFIQSHKGLDNACLAARDGGAVLLAAECAEGTGNPSFLQWFEHGGAASMAAALRGTFVINGQTAFATREKAERCCVALLSSLPPDDVRRMGMTPVASLEEGIGFCRAAAGNDALCALMPDAALVLPRIGGVL